MFILINELDICQACIQKMIMHRLESQYTGALERSQIIKDELILERQNNEELKCVISFMVVMMTIMPILSA